MLSFIGAIVLAYFCFGEWNNRTLYKKYANNNAIKVLQWIQAAQINHKKTYGSYTDSLQELVLIPDSAGDEFSSPRDLVKNQLENDPGRLNPKSRLGPYYYSLLKVDDNDFVAEARWQGSAKSGEDIWQISSRGDVTHPVASNLATQPLWISISGGVMLLLFIASVVFFNSANRQRILKRRNT